MSAMMTGTAYINNGPPLPCQILLEHHYETITSLSPKPDPDWSYVDAAGHFHAFDQTPDAERYPTLRRRVEVVPCTHSDHDDDCDGANIIHWHCAICDEEIEPRQIPGPHSEHLLRSIEWSAKVGVPATEAEALFGPDRVSLRAEVGGMHVFGVAMVTASTISANDRATVELIGIGPLGRTKARQPVPA